MLFYLILLFTIVPIVELALLIRVGQIIGVANTISIVILTGVTGALLARSQGLKVLREIQMALDMGLMPTEKLFDGFMILAGGILLLTPGLITDGIGFLALIPASRSMMKVYIKNKLRRAFEEGRTIHFTYFHR